MQLTQPGIYHNVATASVRNDLRGLTGAAQIAGNHVRHALTANAFANQMSLVNASGG
jgi:hypothetical protein